MFPPMSKDEMQTRHAAAKRRRWKLAQNEASGCHAGVNCCPGDVKVVSASTNLRDKLRQIPHAAYVI